MIFSILLAVALDPGIGKVHFPVSTKNRQAQQYFDQGMAYLYGFNHEAAVKSFQQAAQLDPTLAMADWGIALALGPNINLDVDPDREKQAYAAVQSALTKQASAKERDLIAVLAKRYSNDPSADLKKHAADYSQAMGELSKKYPDDLDIATLYAESMMDLRPWKFWSHEGKPAPQTEDIVAVLESVLKRNPEHPGAAHLSERAVGGLHDRFRLAKRQPAKRRNQARDHRKRVQRGVVELGCRRGRRSKPAVSMSGRHDGSW